MSRRRLVPSLVRALFPGVSRAHVGGLSALVVLIAVLMWATPLSPLALSRADSALGLGDANSAAVQYDRIAALNPLPSVRQEALYRGALVWAVDLGEPEEARKRLERLVATEPGRDRLADVQERIGQTWLDSDKPGSAARAFLRAVDADPKAPEAARRLEAAARARIQGNDVKGAISLWKRLGHDFPERLADATIAQAELALSANDAEGALTLYTDAAPLVAGSPLEAVVRFGTATCLERLGSLEEALAEIDAADLPEEVRERRAEAMKARLAAGSQF